MWVAGAAEQYPDYEILNIDVNIAFAPYLLESLLNRRDR